MNISPQDSPDLQERSVLAEIEILYKQIRSLKQEVIQNQGYIYQYNMYHETVQADIARAKAELTRRSMREQVYLETEAQMPQRNAGKKCAKWFYDIKTKQHYIDNRPICFSCRGCETSDYIAQSIRPLEANLRHLALEDATQHEIIKRGLQEEARIIYQIQIRETAIQGLRSQLGQGGKSVPSVTSGSIYPKPLPNGFSSPALAAKLRKNHIDDAKSDERWRKSKTSD